MTDLDFSVEVSRGMAWLDEHYGAGWEERINVDELDMNSCSKCVLGQVFADSAPSYSGGYGYACGLMDSFHERYYLGFSLPRLDGDHPEWKILRDTWVSELGGAA